MTHVLHLTTWYPYIDGVSGSFVVEQCSALRASGLRVGLIFSRVEGLNALNADRFIRGLPGFISEEVPLPILGFKSWNLPAAGKFVRHFNRHMLSRLYRRYEIRYGTPTILHAHVALETGLAARQLARKNGIEYILTEHSSEILVGNLDTSDRRIAEEVYSGARCVFAVSTRLAERIQEIAPCANIKVVGNLVRESVYQLRRTKRAERSRFQIISISSLVKAKRIDNAIDAIAALPENLKRKVTYHVIGQGPEREALEVRALRAGVDVIFYGGLPHDLAMQHLSNADMLLHPSSYETFGIVLAEAMAVGLPVIATRCGGPETIVSDETGLLVSVDNLVELTNAIELILDSIEYWKKKSSKISQYSRSLFHEKSISKLIIREYI